MQARAWAAAAAGLVGLIASAGAMAQSIETPASITTDAGSPEARQPTAGRWAYTLGLGLGLAPDYEGSDDYKAVPIPYARIQKGYQFGQLFGLHATSSLINHPNWRLGPSLNYRQGYSNVDDDLVDKLTNREGSLELGVKGGYDIVFKQVPGLPSTLSLAVEFLHDISGGHEGWVLTPSAAFRTPLTERWHFRAGAEFSYASDNYMNHYFSIDSADSRRSGLRTFNADAGIKDFAFTPVLSYELAKNWDLNLIGQYKRMTNDAENSPIVDKRGDADQWFGGFVIAYTW